MSVIASFRNLDQDKDRDPFVQDRECSTCMHRRRELVGRPFGPPGQPNLGPCPFLEVRSRSSYIES